MRKEIENLMSDYIRQSTIVTDINNNTVKMVNINSGSSKWSYIKFCSNLDGFNVVTHTQSISPGSRITWQIVKRN